MDCSTIARADPGCTTNGDCDPPLVCLGGECRLKTCRDDYDCPDGFRCKNGGCVVADSTTPIPRKLYLAGYVGIVGAAVWANRRR